MRIAIYVRVSTLDKDQRPENQLEPLRAWCSNNGHEIVAEYIEHKSGRKSADQRPELARLLDDAHKAKFDLVLVWALDRLSREGTFETITYLKRLHACGVSVHSYSEPALSTDNEMVRASWDASSGTLGPVGPSSFCSSAVSHAVRGTCQLFG